MVGNVTVVAEKCYVCTYVTYTYIWQRKGCDLLKHNNRYKNKEPATYHLVPLLLILSVTTTQLPTPRPACVQVASADYRLDFNRHQPVFSWRDGCVFSNSTSHVMYYCNYPSVIPSWKPSRSAEGLYYMIFNKRALLGHCVMGMVLLLLLPSSGLFGWNSLLSCSNKIRFRTLNINSFLFQ